MRFRELPLARNAFSRPQMPMGDVLAVVMHYTQAPGMSASDIRDYFDSLKSGREGRSASAHYAVDEDEAIMMVPRDEIAYHCGSGSAYPIGYTQFAIDTFHDYPNAHAIGIEMCVNLKGELEPRTIDNARAVAAINCQRFDLDPMTQIVRHYDITGKSCPRAWVERPAEFHAFCDSVRATMVALQERGEAIA